MAIYIIRRSDIKIDINSTTTLPSNLDEVKGRTDALPNLTRQQKAVVRCDINKFSKAVGRKPENISCDPAILSALLEEARPAAENIDRVRWRNIKSGIRRALKLVGVEIASGRSSRNSEWNTLHRQLPTPDLLNALSRGLGFFSEHGIAPAEMCQGYCDRFAYALQHHYLVKNWAMRYRMFCRAWNEAVYMVPGWPQVLVEVPDRRPKSLIPKMDELTERLKQDIGGYMAFRAKPYLADNDDDDEDDWEEIDPMRPTSLQKAEYQLRRAVGHLVACGVPLADLTCIADLVSVGMFKRLRDRLIEENDQEGNSQDWGTLCTLTGAARHWVYKNPDDKRLKKLLKLAKALKPVYDGITEKNQIRLKAAIESANFKRLLDLPARLADLARDPRTPTMAAVHVMQLAVAIRILLVVGPVRVSTLVLTTVGKHLHGSRPGLQGDVLLRYTPKEVKNKVGLSFAADRGTIDLIAEYMATYRPRLEYGDPNALFPGESGPSKGGGTLANQISKVIREHAGLDFNVHLFRHFAGYVYLRRHPGDYETVRRLLGHKDIATTMKSYIWIDTETAISRYQDMIVQLMEDK